MDWKQEVLDCIAACKAEAGKPRHCHFDQLAVGIITQEQIALKMAYNLNHWLELTKNIQPLHSAGTGAN